MSVFAVLADPTNTTLEPVIKEAFPDDFLKIRSGQFLIASKSTVTELTDRILGKDGQNGSAIIVAVSSYYGRSSPQVWDWIKTKWANGV